MQVCDQCGACREVAWRRCPFCQADLTPLAASASTDGDRFDALAAAAEISDGELLPSPVDDDDNDDAAGPIAERITEDDLAHLTGLAGPELSDWEQSPPPPSDTEADDAVPRFLVIPLIAAAVVAVVFVAYSIVTQSRPERPDAVALIDLTTTTIATTTTTTEPATPFNGAITIGDDIAEQAARMCRGDQYSIARAEQPSTAIYNDVMVAVQDGRAEWEASPDQEMLRAPVPPLIGCLETVDAGEIDRCPDAQAIISRRAVAWRYRLLSTIDGTVLAMDSGEATEVRPCEELVALAGGDDYGSWSPLPFDRFDAVSAAHTEAPHPQEACQALVDRPAIDAIGLPEEASDDAEEPVGPGRSIHATTYRAPAVDIALPEGWAATADRPVEAVLCFIETDDLTLLAASEEGPDAADDADRAEPLDGEPADTCSITIAAMSRAGELIDSWEYLAAECPAGASATVPTEWLVQNVGPTLGYVLDQPDESGDSDQSDPSGEGAGE